MEMESEESFEVVEHREGVDRGASLGGKMVEEPHATEGAASDDVEFGGYGNGPKACRYQSTFPFRHPAYDRFNLGQG